MYNIYKSFIYSSSMSFTSWNNKTFMWNSIIESSPFTSFNWTWWCARVGLFILFSKPCIFWSAHGLFTPWTMNSSQDPVKFVNRCWTRPVAIPVGPTLNTSPKPHSKKTIPCRYPCYTWDLRFGTPREVVSPNFHVLNGWDYTDWL